MFDRLRALTTRQQILLVAGLVAASGIVLIALWYVFLRVPYQTLFTELRPSDAAAIVADLDRKKISYRLADGGATILVPADIADRTRLDVMTADIPLKGTVGFELFDKSDMGLTDFAQKINYQRALQGELERTIATLDGVDSARVHLSLGEDRIFRDDQVPPKASVTIWMRKGFVLGATAARGIQRLIAAAVPNLEAANVVILDERGREVESAAPQARSDVSAPPPLDQERHAIEEYYEARVRMALERAYPLADIAVDVSAEEAQLAAPASGAPPDWNPAARNFPLRITITPASALDGGARDAVRSLVATAVASDPAKNDVITFGTPSEVGEISPAASQPAARHTVDVVDGLPQPAADNLQPVVTVLLFFVLAAIAGIFLWQMRRPKRLSDAQRAQLAAKFRSLLKEEDRHAAS